jgi:CRISPR-associated endonuclease/helicase Cas3
MGLRALPEEEPDKEQRQPTPLPRVCRGAQDGDPLPEVRLGPEVSQVVTLDLGLMELGEDEDGRQSWSARTQELLARHGPFRLAYLEALLRAADWGASKAEREEPRDA